MKIGLLCKNDIYAKQKAEEFKQNCGLECEYLNDDAGDITLIVTFGGDGTVLQAVKYAIKFNAPIVSVHMGNLGFLCAFSCDDLSLVYEAIKNKKIDYETKFLIETQLNGTTYYSLNEITIQREISNNSFGTAVNLQLYLNDFLTEECLSDGIIISTPNGSTAYSLSAGGAVLTPDLDGLITTAICPHSLHNRSIVFGSNNIARIFVKKCDIPCKVYSDGAYVGGISSNESLICKKSNKRIKISISENYFSKLNKKLRFWGDRG